VAKEKWTKWKLPSRRLAAQAGKASPKYKKRKKHYAALAFSKIKTGGVANTGAKIMVTFNETGENITITVRVWRLLGTEAGRISLGAVAAYRNSYGWAVSLLANR